MGFKKLTKADILNKLVIHIFFPLSTNCGAAILPMILLSAKVRLMINHPNGYP